MPLTPQDVANKQFTSRKVGRGYDETEVDDFLDDVEAELTRLLRENDELKAKLATAQRAATAAPSPAPVDEAARPEPVAPAGAAPAEQATGILALAQKTANDHIAEARSQADRIVGEARSKADALAQDAEERHRQSVGTLEQERAALERKVDDLRAFEREYRSRLKSYLEGQLRELEGRGGDAARPPVVTAAASAGGDQHGPRTSPFSPAAPVRQPGEPDENGASSGPPQQASYAVDEGPEPH